ncbi:hypothetical protein [Flavobacterium cellulosilyticum]|uniref:Uncharacterized protein n=1 Tax=Flavobacterium cellulosilyticum TaxID=2541731 RepID=A0A4R5C5K2_9FLAO|nr:hypothetical protein [Flavobacterium cellulosilyticum]TDD94938.1 hypothetical protein E0F76_15565 [Flavobacterium cellulosilyticum]
MNNKKSITYLLIIIFFLVICSATSIGYIIGNSNANKQNTPIATNPEDNPKINSEINDLKSVYNSKIAEKKANYKELEMERNKVQELLIELDDAKGDANSLLKYKEQYKNLEGKMRLLVDEIVTLKGNKIKAVSNVIASKKARHIYKVPQKVIAQISKTEIIVPIKTEDIPEKKAEKTATELKLINKVVPELKVANLETIGYRIKSADVSENTSLAKKTNFIRVSFSVTGNPNSLTEEKKYYIQVINSKNNVLGSKITEYIDGKTLTYSTMKVVQFDGKTSHVESDITADKFEQGIYFISVFDRSELVAKTKINLD